MERYESEHTQFMREMNEQHPEWEAERQAGRALLWDRTVDQEEARRLREVREANRPYPYDVNFSAKPTV